MKIANCCIAITLGLALGASARADVPSDFRLQSDRATLAGVGTGNAHALDDHMYAAHYQYLDSLLHDGYPLHSVMLHAVSRGMTVSDTAYYLTLARPDAAEEIWATFAELLPSLPSWVCGSELDMSYHRRSSYDLADLDGTPTIHAVAQRFFANDETLRYRRPQKDPSPDWEEPDWTRGEYHFKASIDELIALAEASTFDNRQGWWYQETGPATGGGPVFVGLYRRNGEIVVNTPLAELEAMKRAGSREVPVIIVFNTPEYVPTYRISRADGETSRAPAADTPGRDGRGEEPTIGDVADAYFGQAFIGTRLTPTREWHRHDYHIMAEVAEIEKLFDLPKAGDLAPAERQRYRSELAGGFGQPALVTLLGDGKKMWIDDPARIAVAAEMGMTKVPVAFFYHDFRRYACNLPGTCLPAARDAILAATQAPKPIPPGGGGTGTPVAPVLPRPVLPPGTEIPGGLRPPDPTSPE